MNLPRSICNLKSLKHLQYGIDYDTAACGSDGKASERWGGLLRLLGLEKSRPDPPPCWSSVLSSLNRLCSLTCLWLCNCNIQEGDIPDDIGCLSLLEDLDLCGNNFVSLPESIRRLSRLRKLNLERCKSLQQLPPLPSQSRGAKVSDWTLFVLVNNCTSLRRFSDPSNLYGVFVHCLNCNALVPDEGWINSILSWVLRYAPYLEDEVVIPGSEIPEWFNFQSVGHSVNVELPPPSCTNWLGIAFCVVFQDPLQNLANTTALRHYRRFQIRCSSNFSFYRDSLSGDMGSLVSEHLWIFYLPKRQLDEDCHQEQFLFETYFDDIKGRRLKADWNIVKKCRARLVYEQDLKELNRKLLKQTREYHDEAPPCGPRSASFNDTEQICKKQCY